MTDEAVEGALKEYEQAQLRETNEWAVKGISGRASSLLCNYGPIDEKYEEELREKIVSNKFAQRDLQLIIGYVTPYLPFIGLITVGLTIGEYILRSRREKEEKEVKVEKEVDLD